MTVAELAVLVAWAAKLGGYPQQTDDELPQLRFAEASELRAGVVDLIKGNTLVLDRNADAFDSWVVHSAVHWLQAKYRPDMDRCARELEAYRVQGDWLTLNGVMYLPRLSAPDDCLKVPATPAKE